MQCYEARNFAVALARAEQNAFCQVRGVMFSTPAQ